MKEEKLATFQVLQSYNGWTNRETWLVNVWDFPQIIEPEDKTQNDVANELRSLVEAYLEESMPETSGFAADILPSIDIILDKINFQELAEHIVE